MPSRGALMLAQSAGGTPEKPAVKFSWIEAGVEQPPQADRRIRFADCLVPRRGRLKRPQRFRVRVRVRGGRWLTARGQEAFRQVGRIEKDQLFDARSIRLTQLDHLHAGSGMADEYGLVDTEGVEDRDV